MNRREIVLSELNSRIRNKKDTVDNWETNDPIILDGELIVVVTAESNIRLKIGDGTRTYSELPFIEDAIYSYIEDSEFAKQDSVDSLISGLRSTVNSVTSDLDALSSRVNVVNSTLDGSTQRMEEIADRVTDLSSEMNTLSSNIAGNSSSISENQTAIESLENEVESMKKSISVEYASIGKYSRFEDYEDGSGSKFTGCFFIGGE